MPPHARELLDELMLEDLAMPQGHRGKANQPVALGYVRDLGREDYDLKASGVSGGSTQAGTLQQLRDTHHSLARLIAGGESQTRAAFMTGRSVSRVSILMADPTFKELVEYYRANRDMAFEGVNEELASLGMAATRELRERLETAPDSFSNGEMRKLAEFALDRTLTKDSAPGKPPASSVVINIQGVAPKARASTPVVDLEVEEVHP